MQLKRQMHKVIAKAIAVPFIALAVTLGAALFFVGKEIEVVFGISLESTAGRIVLSKLI